MKALIPQLANKNILVIGDVILDEYLTGRATRMSREAPVPVLEFESRRLIPGGAANPAVNIVALGSRATQVAVVGSDDFGQQLCHLLSDYRIDIGGIVTDAARSTTVKTRLMAHMGLRFPQQVARLDRVSREAVQGEIEQQIREFITANITAYDAILVSDYHAGLLTPSLVNTIRQHANGMILTADVQGELEKYRGFTLVKCNADEASDHLRKELLTNADFEEAAALLRDSLQIQGAVVITRGADGATFAAVGGEVAHCPAPSVTDVYDTVGAGDTAIAVLTLAVAAGATYTQAVTLANYASGIVVRRLGNYAPSPQELAAAIK